MKADDDYVKSAIRYLAEKKIVDWDGSGRICILSFEAIEKHILNQVRLS